MRYPRRAESTDKEGGDLIKKTVRPKEYCYINNFKLSFPFSPVVSVTPSLSIYQSNLIFVCLLKGKVVNRNFYKAIYRFNEQFWIVSNDVNPSWPMSRQNLILYDRAHHLPQTFFNQALLFFCVLGCIRKHSLIFSDIFLIIFSGCTGPLKTYIGLYREKYTKFEKIRFCPKYQIYHIYWLVNQIYPQIKNAHQIWEHLDT